MSNLITKEEFKLIKAIRKENGELWEKLAAKCKWEHMIPAAVLHEGWFDKEIAEFKKTHKI